MIKTCPKCKREKPAGEFYKRPRNAGLSSRCKRCTIIESEAWRKAHPEKARKAVKSFYARNPERHRIWSRTRQLKKYGLTDFEFDAMVALQNSRCAICAKQTKLVVDHCHASGKVRKLLCAACNNTLGFAKDSAVILRKAAEYLEQFSKSMNAKEETTKQNAVTKNEHD